MHGTGDFITYERHLPEERPEEIRWAEFCNPWNGNWPYVERPYKSLGYVLGELVTSRAWGINYLLGIGPMASGDLAPEAYENMQKAGEWMKKNREAVYAVRPLPINEEASVLASSNRNKRYLYLVPRFKDNSTSDTDLLPNEDMVVSLKGVPEPSGVVFLANSRKLNYVYAENDSVVTIRVPATDRSNLVDVICVTFP